MLTEVRRRLRSGVLRRQVCGMVFSVRLGPSLSARSHAPVRPATPTATPAPGTARPNPLADTFMQLIKPRSPDPDINPCKEDSLPAQASRHPTRQVPLQY